MLRFKRIVECAMYLFKGLQSVVVLNTMSAEDDKSVLLSIFKSGRRKLKVFYHKKVIVWDNTKPPSGKFVGFIDVFVFCLFFVFTFRFAEQETLPIENVIAVHNNAARSTSSTNERESNSLIFTIHYAQRSQGRTWKYCQITFKHTDPAHVSSWVKTLQSDLQSTLLFCLIIILFNCFAF